MSQATDPLAKQPLPILALAALGVVYGDIGTSPLYTMQEAFAGTHPLTINTVNVMGILSLIFWTLTIVVSVKYVLFVMRVDNRGEGCIISMLALVEKASADRPRSRMILTMLGIFGAALFYGDGMITPAISVLSAVEGLKVVTPDLDPLIVPLSLAILIALFFIQSHGTARVGSLFGPVMVIWFVALAILGAINIAHAPEVMAAINPLYALNFFAAHKIGGFLALGAVVLAVTGAEALYADMGHFGRRPIQYAWFGLVMPALVLNYFGQGALLLHDPRSVSNPFFHLAPAWAVMPLVVLATVATIIASQAVITGAFSMTSQAIQLGYLPRMAIHHTSEREIGQIYLPFINWSLLVGIVLLVLGFQSSASLGVAYGMAVTGTMTITSVLGFYVVSFLWRWNRAVTLLGLVTFMTVDLAFLGANALKIVHGGWFPLLIGAGVYVLLSTWKKGRALLNERLSTGGIPLEPFIESLMVDPPHRVSGMAVFLNAQMHTVPHAMLHNLAHNKVLHEHVVFLTVRTEDVPFVPERRRAEVANLDNGFYTVVLRYGFKETPDIPAAMMRCPLYEEGMNVMETSFFFSRETLIPVKEPSLSLWRAVLFAWMARNAQGAMRFFRIPPNRVIELGTQVEL